MIILIILLSLEGTASAGMLQKPLTPRGLDILILAVTPHGSGQIYPGRSRISAQPGRARFNHRCSRDGQVSDC